MVNFYSEWQEIENPDDLKAIKIDYLCLNSANSNVSYFLSRKEENISYTEILRVENQSVVLSKDNPIKIKYITDLHDMSGIEKNFDLDSENKKIIFSNLDLENHSILVCYYLNQELIPFINNKENVLLDLFISNKQKIYGNID